MAAARDEPGLVAALERVPLRRRNRSRPRPRTSPLALAQGDQRRARARLVDRRQPEPARRAALRRPCRRRRLGRRARAARARADGDHARRAGAGLGAVLGALAPGKKADVLVVGGDRAAPLRRAARRDARRGAPGDRGRTRALRRRRPRRRSAPPAPAASRSTSAAPRSSSASPRPARRPPTSSARRSTRSPTRSPSRCSVRRTSCSHLATPAAPRHRAELPGRRGHPFLDEVGEAFHLGRDVAPARVDDVDGRRGRRPAGQHAFEAARAQLLDAPERRQQRDADAGGGGRVKDVAVVREQAGRETHLRVLVATFETQRTGSGCRTAGSRAASGRRVTWAGPAS